MLYNVCRNTAKLRHLASSEIERLAHLARRRAVIGKDFLVPVDGLVWTVPELSVGCNLHVHVPHNIIACMLTIRCGHASSGVCQLEMSKSY